MPLTCGVSFKRHFTSSLVPCAGVTGRLGRSERCGRKIWKVEGKEGLEGVAEGRGREASSGRLEGWKL